MLMIKDLTKTFRGSRGEDDRRVLAVDNVSLEVGKGKMFTLLGPSGCGKTTTLRCVAGLERPDSGEIEVGGRVLYSSNKGVRTPANERRLGMVFQSYAIWPHMNVFNNVAFPLQVGRRSQRASRAEISDRVMRVLDVMRLAHLAKRPATDLSGGQQQRLALARAVVLEPPLLLLDEPLSNLDAKLREEMRFELKRLQEELRITSIYVTHDQAEALAMSDAIALMNGGVLQQVGTPREIYENPASYFVADFIGVSNFLDANVLEHRSDGAYLVECPEGQLVASSQHEFTSDDDIVLGIRPEYVDVKEATDDAGPANNEWRGRVVAAAFQGETMSLLVEVSTGTVIRAHCKPTTPMRQGDDVIVGLPAEHCYLVSRT